MRHLFEIVSISVLIFFRSLAFWPLRDWFLFWATFPPARVVPIGRLQLSIRTCSLRQKIVDLYTAVYCILEEEYFKGVLPIPDDAIIVDVGGHAGAFALAASLRAPRGRVVVLEPDPKNFAVLAENIRINNVTNVKLISAALASKEGTFRFYHDSWNTSSSGMFRKTGESYEVSATTLSALFRGEGITRCDLLKMDCEAAEYDILETLPPEMFKTISQMAFEVHDPHYFNLSGERYSEKYLTAFLERMGFSVSRKPESSLHNLLFAVRTARA